MEYFNALKLPHEILGRTVVWHQFRLAHFIDVVDLPDDELGISMGSQGMNVHGEREEEAEDECFVLCLVVGALFLEEGE
jgi:hypothetical protein